MVGAGVIEQAKFVKVVELVVYCEPRDLDRPSPEIRLDTLPPLAPRSPPDTALHAKEDLLVAKIEVVVVRSDDPTVSGSSSASKSADRCGLMICRTALTASGALADSSSSSEAGAALLVGPT